MRTDRSSGRVKFRTYLWGKQEVIKQEQHVRELAACNTVKLLFTYHVCMYVLVGTIRATSDKFSVHIWTVVHTSITIHWIQLCTTSVVILPRGKSIEYIGQVFTCVQTWKGIRYTRAGVGQKWRKVCFHSVSYTFFRTRKRQGLILINALKVIQSVALYHTVQNLLSQTLLIC